MPRRTQHPQLPLDQHPRTRSIVQATGATLVALPNTRQPPAPHPLPAPAYSTYLDVSSIALGATLLGPAANPSAHVECSFRGQTWLLNRQEWNDPEEQRVRAEKEDAIWASERAARLKRQQVGMKGKKTRQAA